MAGQSAFEGKKCDSTGSAVLASGSALGLAHSLSFNVGDSKVSPDLLDHFEARLTSECLGQCSL